MPFGVGMFSNQVQFRPPPSDIYQLTHPGSLEAWLDYADSFGVPQRKKASTGTTGTKGGTGVGGMPQSLGGGTSPEQIIQLVNEINQRAQQTANAGRIPGGGDLEALSSANISSALSGQLDPSVINQIAQRQAERGAQMGIAPGSPSNNAAYLKAIGLNSLDLMGQGQNWLTQAVGRNPAAPIYNAGNMVLTPEQQAQIDLQNRSLQETIRANQERERIAWNEANRRNAPSKPYLSGMFGVGGGDPLALAKQFSAENEAKRRAASQPSLPDLFTPATDTRYAPAIGNSASNWAADLPIREQQATPSWVMPQTTFQDGTPDLGNIMDGSLYGSMGFNATSNWEDDPFAWAWE